MGSRKLKAAQKRTGFAGHYALELALLHNALDRSSNRETQGKCKPEGRLANIRRQVHILQIKSGQPMTDFGNERVATLPKGDSTILVTFADLPLVDQINSLPFLVRYLASKGMLADTFMWGEGESERYDGLYIDLGRLDVSDACGIRNRLVIQHSHPTEVGIAMTEKGKEGYGAIASIPVGYLLATWRSSVKPEELTERGELIRCIGEYLGNHMDVWREICVAHSRMA